MICTAIYVLTDLSLAQDAYILSLRLPWAGDLSGEICNMEYIQITYYIYVIWNVFISHITYTLLTYTLLLLFLQCCVISHKCVEYVLLTFLRLLL